MIRFKYKPSDGLLEFLHKQVVDYNDDILYGSMPEDTANKLRHCSLFIVCEYESNDNVNIFRNPLAVVAMNDKDAAQVYKDETGKQNAGILTEAETRCDRISVEPIT